MQLLVFVAALAASAASATVLTTPIKLPLRWVDRRAYVTTVVLDGVPTVLEVATTTSDVWLSCSSLTPFSVSTETCRTTACSAVMALDGVSVCTSQTKTSLSIANAALTLDEFPVQIMLDGRNTTTKFTQEKHGELGLGLRSGVFGSMYPELQSNKTLVESIGNFSVFLTDGPGGNGSFIQLGGSFPNQLHGFDKSELSDRQLSTRFSLPLRLDKSVGLRGWDLSLTAVRFGDDQLLYARIYAPSEIAGSDAVVTVSVSDPVMKMPPSILKYFRETYMKPSCVLRENDREGYACGANVSSSLPRIAFYVGDKIFYLDPSDYTVPTSTKLLVLISASSSESRWVLGSPFLRKFPSMFSLPARCIDLLCQFNVSCDSTPLGDAWDRRYVPTNEASNTSITIEEGKGVATAPTLHSPAGAKVVMWMGFLFGTLGCCLATISAVNRWRHRHDPEIHGNGTVASDKDLEELELAIRELSTTESVGERRSNFTPLASPTATAR